MRGSWRRLFSDHGGDCTLTQPDLLNELVIEKLDALAAPLRAEGWSRVVVQIETPDRTKYVGYKRAEPVANVPLSEDDAARKAVLEARQDELCKLDEITDEQDE